MDILKNPIFSRRDFIKWGLLMSGSFLTACSPRLKSLAKWVGEQYPEEGEKLNPNKFEVGFTTHAFDFGDKDGITPNLESFKNHVDILTSAKQQWLRFDLRPWHLFKVGDENGIEFNEENIKIYKEGIDYAKSRGLKLYAHIFPPDYSFSPPDWRQMDMDKYVKATKLYYKGLMEKLKSDDPNMNGLTMFDVVQIANEPDWNNFLNYNEKIYDLSDSEYLDKLDSFVGAAREAVKEVDPQTQITLNMAHWDSSFSSPPWNDWRGFKERANIFWSRMNQYIDIASIDPYPYDIDEEIKALPELISYFHEITGKEVMVSELGVPGGINEFSEAYQSELISKYLSAIRSGNIQPSAVILYQLSDEIPNGQSYTDYMGIIRADGLPKESFKSVMDEMRPPVNETGIPTPISQLIKVEPV